ncbi:NAD(P)/FAD-dependent oxidoreductase [Profundibacter sp.]|uniref:NAD(P)/FAD-dependent oxidoreductase n=1 Tax=Profundibacter sp. TaxID=3101071 RepID=UPI003D0C3438
MNTPSSPYDVAIIGAGIVGCAMARRFTLEGARVVLLEKTTDILDGASKANSAILHTGFDAPVGSIEVGCVQAGHEEYRQIYRDFGLTLDECGAHVVAWSDEEVAKLEQIQQQAVDNNVMDTRLITGDELRTVEPNLSDRALAAIAVPSESLIDPWSSPYAYLHQSLMNGGEVMLSCEVTGGRFDGNGWKLETTQGLVWANHVVNCAGLYGDLVNSSVFGQASFTITPRKGQFVVYDKAASRLARSVILPVPTARTKGIVLFRTVFGNLAVGPTAEDQQSRTDSSIDTETLQSLMAAGEAIMPALKGMPVTATYAGLRPATEFKDYQISADAANNWITVGGIRSTGLSGALGIAQYTYGLYRDMGADHTALTDPAIPTARVLTDVANRDWKEKDHGEIVCHCELVTRREIEAALSGPLAAKSLAGLKRQTRVTMGRCQGFFCSARLAELTEGHFAIPMAEGVDK